MTASESPHACLLEARFHHAGLRDEFVVVAYVVCEGPQISILEAHQSAVLRPSRAVLSNLKYLVLMGAPQPYEFLRQLDNPFWSFVDVGNRLTQVPRANDN